MRDAFEYERKQDSLASHVFRRRKTHWPSSRGRLETNSSLTLPLPSPLQLMKRGMSTFSWYKPEYSSSIFSWYELLRSTRHPRSDNVRKVSASLRWSSSKKVSFVYRLKSAYLPTGRYGGSK